MKLFTILVFFILGKICISQSTANYTFSTNSNGSLILDMNSNAVDLTSGATSILAASIDNSAGTLTDFNLGSGSTFDFFFMGNRYYQFSATSNGIIRLGSTASGTTYNIPNSTNPTLSPFAADLKTGTDGGVRAKVVGSAPNRCLVIEFYNMNILLESSAAGTGTYQVRLYESTGVIEYMYGAMARSAGTSASTSTVTIGFSINTTSTNLISVNTSSHTASTVTPITTNTYSVSTTITDLNSISNGSRRFYRFTPLTSLAAPTSLTFSSVTATTTTLNWTAASPTTNIRKYAIYNSTDNTTFNYVNTVNVGTNTLAFTGLTPSTTYYYKVYSISEGCLSTALSNSQATTAPGSITSTTSGNWSSGSTWVGGIVPTSNDNVTIANGHTVTIDATSTCYNLTVGSGVSGALIYEATTARTLTVTNNVTINSGGSFQSAATGTQTAHSLSLAGNLTNNGTLDFSTNTNTAATIITFTGSSNTTFSGSGGTTDIKSIILNKGTSTVSILELSTSNFTVQGVNTDVAAFLTLTKGTFKISGSFTMTNRIITGTSYTIAANTGLFLNNENFTVQGQAGIVTLNGLLQINAGTFNIGLNATNQCLKTGASTSVLTISGGSLNIYSHLEALLYSLAYTQSGGTVTVASGVNSTSYSFLIFQGTFNMSGGSIILRYPTSSSYSDYQNFATSTVTGGTLQLGDASSGAAKTFVIGGNIPNLLITNTSGNHTGIIYKDTYTPNILLTTTLQNNTVLDAGFTYATSLTFTGNVTIGTGAELKVGISTCTINGSWTNNGTFTPKTGNNMLFTGTGSKTLTGMTNFYDLSTSSSTTLIISQSTTITRNLTLNGTSTVDLNAAIDVNGDVTINSGCTLLGGSSTHTIAGNWWEIGTHTEEGGTIDFDGSSSQIIKGTSVNFENLTHSGSGTLFLKNNIDVNGNISLTNGELSQSSFNINIAKNWTNTGNYFKEGSGSTTFDGNSNSTISSTTSNFITTNETSLLTESFENAGAIPTGWSTLIVNDTGTDPIITYTTSSTNPSSFAASAGSYFAKMNSYNAADLSQVRLYNSTSFSTTGKTNIIVNFDISYDVNLPGYQDNVVIQYSTDGASWTSSSNTIFRYSMNGSAWASYSIELPIGAENQANLYIGFLFTSGYGNNIYLDNISVTGDVIGAAYSGEIFKQLEINKSGGAYISLASNANITNTLTLTSGLIKTAGNTLTIGTNSANGSISGGSSSTYIVAYDNGGTIGYLKQFVNSNTAYSYPIGDENNYTPLTFTLTSNGGLASAYYTVYTKAVKVPGLNSAFTTYITRFWEGSSSGMTTPVYSLSYTYTDADIVGTETALLPIKKSGTTWYKPTGSSFTNSTTEGTGSVNATTNTLTWTGLSTFSFNGGAGSQVIALPISLIAFKVEKLNNINVISWQTASEKNNDYFTIEHTIDGQFFETIGQKNGAGTTFDLIEYEHHHYDVPNSINYYRLKQTDFDGNFTFSELVSVDNRTTIGQVKIIVNRYNLLGQEIDEFYKGIIIVLYSDGSTEKIIINKD